MKSTQTRLGLILGDITKTEVDAIVNPTDHDLSGTGVVDYAIRRAGGRGVDRACQEIRDFRGGCQTGKVVITAAGNLPTKYIIHTVGPVWVNGQIGEPESLASCYRECLRVAVENGIQSIAFPAVSTGSLGYPIEKAAPIALKTVTEFVVQAQQRRKEVPNYIQFVLFNEEAYTCYVKAFLKLGLSLFCLIG